MEVSIRSVRDIDHVIDYVENKYKERLSACMSFIFVPRFL